MLGKLDGRGRKRGVGGGKGVVSGRGKERCEEAKERTEVLWGRRWSAAEDIVRLCGDEGITECVEGEDCGTRNGN